MNKIVEKAHKIAKENDVDRYFPDLEINEECEINDVWDGEGECPTDSYSHFICDSQWINYEFEVLEEKENKLDTTIRITNIELI